MAKRMYRVARRLVAAGLVLLSIGVRAQQPEEVAAPRFDIDRYVIEGNTLLSEREIQSALAAYTGKQKDFGDIQRALEALEQGYRVAGWGVVQVTLPEQDITQGLVRFRVIEARLGKVIVEGNRHFNVENVRRSVPALREGTTPNSRATAKNLQVGSENPAKQTTALLRSGEKEGEVDAVVKVTDEKPWKVSATLDNTGSTQTGRYRAGIGFQHANFFNRDHMLTAQYIGSPGYWEEVKIFGVGYRVPLYAQGASLDLIGGYSDVNSGTVQNLFTVSGSGTIGALRYNQHLQRLTDYEHKIVYGVDYRAYQNRVIASGTNTVPDITVHPVSVFYSGIYRTEGSELNFYLYAAQNVFSGGNDAGDSTFKAPGMRENAKAAYRLYRYQAAYSRVVQRDWQVRALVSGQYSDDALIPSEQFGIGGADTVRGFLEREASNDRGYRGSLEVYSPDLGEAFGFKDVRSRALAFFDTGSLRRNKALPGEPTHQSISSAGVGLRLAVGRFMSARLDFAQVLDGGGAQRKGDQRLHFSLSLVH